ncbi:MAG: hypothetical protein K1X67_14885 [Fimbriimonadaceae bacterium]|nr:hypothetical protein [Fimbriimonadaceae bacterium]
MTVNGVFKVIPSGVIDGKRLRVTVMFSPSVAFKTLPSTLVKEWREKNWTLRVAKLRVTGEKCPASFADAIQTSATSHGCTATWNAGKAAWSTGTQTWLDDLWEESFKDKKGNLPDDVWAKLAKSLEASNDGNVFQPDKDLDEHSNGKAEVLIRAVVPSRQSDLALLLESERALEICCTAKWAHGDFVGYAEEENRCIGIVSCSNEPAEVGSPKNAGIINSSEVAKEKAQQDLRNDARDRFKKALKAVDDQYAECAQDENKNRASAPWLADPTAIAGDRSQVSKEIPGAAQSHIEANSPKEKPHDDPDPDGIKQRYFAIQGSPSLSRLFGLTVDLEISRDELNCELQLLPGDQKSEATVVHFLIALASDGSSDNKSIWSLVRYRPGGEMHFLPASRFELFVPAQRGELHPHASQHEGVLVLGQEFEGKKPEGDPNAKPPVLSRFALSSLDVQRATNGALDRMVLQRPGEAKPEAPTQPLLACKPVKWARKTHSTAGLVLLDRGRLEQTVSQFAARTCHMKQQIIVLDSADLLVGYRLDIGVPVKGRAREDCDVAWRSLMARNVVHGADSAEPVTRTVRLLMGGTASTPSIWQRTLDDAQLSLPARLVPTSDKELRIHDAYVEEVVAVWTGEPMGAQCAGEESGKMADMPVGVGETVRLPTTGEDPQHRLLPPLRFGWPYRVGVRAVYAGSISLPLQHARQLYEGGASCPKENVLTLPARVDERSGVRRFLRHERISAPYLLMHREIALRSNHSMGFERSAHAIIRSVGNDDRHADRGFPVSTQRIFVPPSVEMHFAAMHGVFDKNPQKLPEQGLPGVRFDAKAGGFPYVTAPSIEGINGEVFEGNRTISVEADQCGDAVYEERTGAEKERQRRYYPDPAAETWVVAVRHAGTNNYLEGLPVTVPIFADSTYPNCRPLVLRIQRDKSAHHRGANPRLQDVLSRPSQREVSPLVTHSTEIAVTLASGDDFDVDVWCVPRAKTMADWFAPVENIGTLALLNARKSGDGNQTLPQKLLAALDKMLPPPMALICKNTLKDYSCWPEADTLQTLQGNDGVGGLSAPGPVTRLAIANALHDTLIARPLDEIAAVQTLRVTHATLRPFRLPAFVPADSLMRLQVRRIEESTPAGTSAGDDSRENAAEYLLEGAVRIDLITTGAIEFRAKTSFPSTSAFDDPRRGRSARDRRNGSWPDQCGQSLKTEHIFGFDVATDGRVTLPEVEISLLQVEELLPPVSCSRELLPDDDGLWRLNIKDLRPGSDQPAWGRIVTRHVFPDRKARRLCVRMVARPRHEELMRTANRVAKAGNWLRPGREAVEPIDDKLPEVPIWLPAGIRPSEPIALTPVPAFVWRTNPDSHTACRTAVIRIPLGRGWFSSGEGERLGIVVWPPGLLNAAAGLPPLPAGSSTCPPLPEVLALPDFMDEDLGPGGRFVTRWGSDPTKDVDQNAPADSRLPGFLDPSSFKDLGPTNSASGMGFTAELAPVVRMPVRVEALPGQLQADIPLTTLDVSLVTYEPRFDIETEQWYVDAAIEHPFEAQPFVRLGLVRFQPHAPEDLQVSFPTTQWVQLLPRRDVRVTYELRNSVEFATVTVEGLGPLDDRFDAADDGVGTRVWAHVMSEYINDAGLVCRSTHSPKPMCLAPVSAGGQAQEEYRGPRRTWSIDIDLDSLPDRNEYGIQEKVKHYIYVEEREAYLPATYVHEPVPPEIASGGLESSMHQESGPRFVARLELNKRIPNGGKPR